MNGATALGAFLLMALSLTAGQLRELKSQARVELARRAAAEGDVLGWGKALMPDKFKLPFCRLHEYLAAHRGDEMSALEAARGHAKTAIGCMLAPMFQALAEPGRFQHFLQVQATDDKALSVNSSIKMELEQNDLIRRLYGDQVGRDRWTNGQFVLRNGACFTAVGAGQSIRGINYRNRRPDNILVDDLYNEEDIHSPESTEKKNAWFWSTLYPARARDRRSSIKITGTPVNTEDLLAQLKGREGWSHATFRAAEDLDRGPALWPELVSLEQLRRDAASMPPTIFARELMCERLDDASSIVKGEWLQSWEYDPADLRFGEGLRYLGCTLGIDPSIGKKAENDPAGYALVIKAQRPGAARPEYYVEALTNRCMPQQERLDVAKAYCAGRPFERPVTAVNVECISGFQDFGDLVAKNVAVPCNLITKVPDKITHLERKSHYFQNRRIFLNRNIEPELKKALVHQLTTNHPKHDDLRDALLHALDDEGANNWGAWV